ncbi:MAG: hypothetical protein LUD16_12905 [Lachnospiraceae bacterium]|nr:hypothetical protein [Lachnospiraceae bacterium]
MKWIIENWYIIVAFVAIAALIIAAAYTFLKLPTSEQIAALKEWLKYAVAIAEKELGGGTGQLKLRMVYDMFVQKFSWLAQFVSFNIFSGYVDEALAWLQAQLESNQAVNSLVTGKSSEGGE